MLKIEDVFKHLTVGEPRKAQGPGKRPLLLNRFRSTEEPRMTSTLLLFRKNLCPLTGLNQHKIMQLRGKQKENPPPPEAGKVPHPGTKETYH